jgi:hypothetical protein
MLLSAVAFAGMNAEHKVAVHVLPYAATMGCTAKQGFPAITGCFDIITTEPAADTHCFPVFFDLVGVTGVQHGLAWPGSYTCVYTKCAGAYQIGDIVNTGDGVAYTWSECQYVAVVVCGFGWIYDYGMVCPVPNPDTGLIGTADCNFVEDAPRCIFCAGIGGYVGDDPCLPTATEASTWGGIKGMFK